MIECVYVFNEGGVQHPGIFIDEMAVHRFVAQGVFTITSLPGAVELDDAGRTQVVGVFGDHLLKLDNIGGGQIYIRLSIVIDRIMIAFFYGKNNMSRETAFGAAFLAYMKQDRAQLRVCFFDDALGQFVDWAAFRIVDVSALSGGLQKGF